MHLYWIKRTTLPYSGNLIPSNLHLKCVMKFSPAQKDTYFGLIKRLHTLCKGTANVWFLRQCIDNNVIPPTFRISIHHRDDLTQELTRKWITTQETASKQLMQMPLSIIFLIYIFWITLNSLLAWI